MVRVAAACLAGVMVVGVLAGCGSVSGAEAARNTATPTPDAVETEPATTTGIEFVNVPLALEGTDADVYSAIAVYERAVWRAGAEQDAGLTVYEQGAPVIEVGGDAPAGAGGTLGGGIQVSIGDIAVDGTTATGVVCRDLSDVTLDGAGSGITEPLQVQTTLTLSDEAWLVESVDHTGTC